ncbi:hypothetical protein PghCCS26_35310 [Paenibacillus glycanilyticus]|uniref:Uncharacterized protein n=1 Tax=Paenibacillus glycanilyticus TaxID=126569 RepID=A0ABQ6NQ99_9BACL|nr:hypothetical protein PghCCS26_35310 [Paenibacillus glycanilyticus]
MGEITARLEQTHSATMIKDGKTLTAKVGHDEARLLITTTLNSFAIDKRRHA